jgi:hypothetical protein
MIAADVNMNGKIRANDITLMQQRIVKVIPEYNQEWNSSPNPYKPSLDWRYIDKRTVDMDPRFKISSTYPSASGVGYWRDNVPPVPFCLPVYPSCLNERTPELYSAIMLGDLISTGGAYNRTEHTLRLAAPSQEKEKKIIFNVVKTTDLPDDYFRVFVRYENPNEDTLVGIDFDIDYDEKKMSVSTLKETQASKEAEMSTMWNDYINQELLLTSYSMKFLPSKGTFFYFDIHRVGGHPKESDFGNILTMLNGEEVPYEFRMSTDIVSNDPESEQPYITVSPNPGNDVSKILFSRSADVNSRIVMYNVLGQTVREFKNLEKEGERVLHLDELASGSYVIIMYTGEEKYSKQFIIQK